MAGLGKLYRDKDAVLKHREWRGFRDTMYDFYRWLVNWKDILKFVFRQPVSVVKGLWRYRWMSSYLTVPAFVDRHLQGLRGPQLRMAHLHFNMIVKHATVIIGTSFRADEKLHGPNKLSDRIVCMDELIPMEIMAGFPNLIGIPVQTMPIFLSSMVDQQIVPPYLDVVENYGVPADVCPLPSGEAGVAICDDFPKFGKCFITCNMPCDGSIMTTSFQERRFRLPSYCLNIPLRYTEEEVQEYALEEIKGCIKFIEEQTIGTRISPQ